MFTAGARVPVVCGLASETSRRLSLLSHEDLLAEMTHTFNLIHEEHAHAAEQEDVPLHNKDMGADFYRLSNIPCILHKAK